MTTASPHSDADRRWWNRLPSQNLPQWRFWLPLVAQAALILSIPSQAIYTQLTGKTVVLQTIPVDPYNLFQGYYVILNYEVSQPDRLRALPGGDFFTAIESAQSYPSLFASDASFYIILEAPQTDNQTKFPEAWQPIAISRDRPAELPDSQIALQGTYRNGRIAYGLEAYYIPEDQRLEINEQISQAQWSETPSPVELPDRPFRVEVKVDSQGRATPISLWINEQHYQF